MSLTDAICVLLVYMSANQMLAKDFWLKVAIQDG